MRTKYTGLQISIHWLVFLLVIMAYCAMEFRGWFPRSDRPLINMIHVSCGISILVLMVARLGYPPQIRLRLFNRNQRR